MLTIRQQQEVCQTFLEEKELYDDFEDWRTDRPGTWIELAQEWVENRKDFWEWLEI